tara:strand:+ start:273 stop:923 length:651 start_codon:yes stop_codon:yes gene_type:complete
MECIRVFTDGSCSNNGRKNAKAGFGVYFGENDPRNVSKRVPGELRQTNNVGEILAIIEVFSILKDELSFKIPIEIYSDSKIAMGWCTTIGEKYAKNNWTKKHGPIPNLDLIKLGYQLLKDNPHVSLKHIRAHTGLSDEYSLGNEGADKLANLAIGLKKCPYEGKRQKYYLNISYDQKEIGKKYGAKWDRQRKKWYYEGYKEDINFKELIQLFPMQS